MIITLGKHSIKLIVVNDNILAFPNPNSFNLVTIL